MRTINREELINMILKNTMAPDEVLEMCNISAQRLRDLNKAERIVPIKRVGNANLYLRQDVEKLRKELEENAKYKPDAYK